MSTRQRVKPLLTWLMYKCVVQSTESRSQRENRSDEDVEKMNTEGVEIAPPTGPDILAPKKTITTIVYCVFIIIALSICTAFFIEICS